MLALTMMGDLVIEFAGFRRDAHRDELVNRHVVNIINLCQALLFGLLFILFWSDVERWLKDFSQEIFN